MGKRNSAVAIFLAATSIIASNHLNNEPAKAGKRNSDMGGLKEWTTDQKINEESKLDENAKKAKKKAEEENICIPIGEGENCW